MMNKDVDNLLSELEKVRKDLDGMKAYQLTIAEKLTNLDSIKDYQLTMSEKLAIIATNTTPADEPAET